jgi:hypothetical protein
MHSVEFFCDSEGQWPIEYSYAGFASSLASTIRHPATSKPEQILDSFSLHHLSAACKNSCLTLQDKGTTFFENLENYTPKYKTSYSRRLNPQERW